MAAPNADIGDGSSRRRTLALRSTGAGTRLISRSRTFSTREERRALLTLKALQRRASDETYHQLTADVVELPQQLALDQVQVRRTNRYSRVEAAITDRISRSRVAVIS